MESKVRKSFSSEFKIDLSKKREYSSKPDYEIFENK